MGVNPNARGAWAVGTTYAANDTVSYENQAWVANAASTGVAPGSDAGVSWTAYAASGVDADSILAAHQDTISNAITVAAAYTASDGDCVFATATCTITLPAPGEAAVVEVISNGASITATVAAPTGSLVNGAASVTVTTQYTKKTFRSDGFNWFAA